MTTPKPEENPVTAWMQRNGLSHEKAAEILKIEEDRLYKWKSTEFPKSPSKIKGIIAMMENYERRSERISNLDLDIHIPVTADQVQRWSLRSAAAGKKLDQWILDAIETRCRTKPCDPADAPSARAADEITPYKPKPKK